MTSHCVLNFGRAPSQRDDVLVPASNQERRRMVLSGRPRRSELATRAHLLAGGFMQSGWYLPRLGGHTALDVPA